MGRGRTQAKRPPRNQVKRQPAKPLRESSESESNASGDEIDSDEAFGGSGDEAAVRYGAVLDDIAQRQKRDANASKGGSSDIDHGSDDSGDEDGGVDDMLAALGGNVSSSEDEQAKTASKTRKPVHPLQPVFSSSSSACDDGEALDEEFSSSSVSGKRGRDDPGSNDYVSDDSSGSSSDESSSSMSGNKRGNDSDDSWLSAGDHNIDDDETEDAAHARMLDAVSSLRGGRMSSDRHQSGADDAGRLKRSYDVVRAMVDEDVYNVASLSSSGRMSYGDVANALGDSDKFADVKEQLESLSKRQRTAAPLPQNVTEKLERKVGYETASQAVTTWQRFVQDMRNSDSLQFPLHQPSYGVSASSLAAHFEPATGGGAGPTNAMEARVYSMLNEAKLTSAQQQAKTEALNALPDVEVTEEEIRRRQAELAKMRHLAFYAEEKNRRRKKIKSKTFRRIQRKARDKQKLTAEELAILDPEAADEADEKQEMKRLRERMTLRHSTSTSKFSQHVKQQRLLGNKGTKEAVESQIRLKDDLKRKMQTLDSESEDLMASESDSHSLGENNGEEEELPKKGLFALSFMRRAQAKAKATAVAAKAAEGDELSHAAMLRSTGASNGSGDPKGNFASELRKQTQATVTGSTNSLDEENPWLAHTTEEGTAASRSRSLKNQKIESSRRRRSLAEQRQGTEPSITPTSSRTLSSGSLVLSSHSQVVERQPANERSSKQPVNTSASALAKSKFDLSGVDAESRALIDAAFAHDDNVEEEFAAEKARIEAEIDAELSGTSSKAKLPSEMPGWGTWGGHGTEKIQAAAQRRREAVKVAEEVRTRAAAPAPKFATKRKANVILQDKRVKAHSKYLLEEVPKPFHTRAQYERTLAVPVGTEWNTRRVFAKRTVPKVTVQPGVSIAPMTASDARQSVSKGNDPNAPSMSKQRRMKQREKKQAHRIAKGTAR